MMNQYYTIKKKMKNSIMNQYFDTIKKNEKLN